MFEFFSSSIMAARVWNKAVYNSAINFAWNQTDKIPCIGMSSIYFVLIHFIKTSNTYISSLMGNVNRCSNSRSSFKSEDRSIKRRNGFLDISQSQIGPPTRLNGESSIKTFWGWSVQHNVQSNRWWSGLYQKWNKLFQLFWPWTWNREWFEYWRFKSWKKSQSSIFVY